MTHISVSTIDRQKETFIALWYNGSLLVSLSEIDYPLIFLPLNAVNFFVYNFVLAGETHLMVYKVCYESGSFLGLKRQQALSPAVVTLERLSDQIA